MISGRAYTLVEYDPAWPTRFGTVAARLRTIFDGDALDIQHVGSTAVPDMIAKPQIDIVVVVQDLALVQRHRAALEAAGFLSRGNYTGIGEEYFTLDNQDGSRSASVHVLPREHVEIAQMIAMRDYLRTHHDERNRYAQMKRATLERHPDDYKQYVASKAPFIKELIARVTAWANARGRA